MKKSALLFLVSLSAFTVGCKTTPTTLPQETRASIQSIDATVKIEQDDILAVSPGAVHATVGGNAGASFGLTLIANVALQGIAQNAVKKYNDVLPGYDFRAAVERELALRLTLNPDARLTSDVIVTDGDNAMNSAAIRAFNSDAQLYFTVEYFLQDGLTKDGVTASIDFNLYSKNPRFYPKDHKGGADKALMTREDETVKVTDVNPQNIQAKMDLLAKKVAEHILLSMKTL